MQLNDSVVGEPIIGRTGAAAIPLGRDGNGATWEGRPVDGGERVGLDTFALFGGLWEQPSDLRSLVMRCGEW